MAWSLTVGSSEKSFGDSFVNEICWSRVVVDLVVLSILVACIWFWIGGDCVVLECVLGCAAKPLARIF